MVHEKFPRKDWSILGKNKHLKSDYIFKALFDLKLSLIIKK